MVPRPSRAVASARLRQKLKLAQAIFGTMLTLVSSKQRAYIRAEHLPQLYTRFHTFDSYLGSKDENAFIEYARLSAGEFMDLHNAIAHRLNHETTHRQPITSMQRLCLFLRWAGHSYTFEALAKEFNVGKSTCSVVISEVTRAIIEVMQDSAFPPVTRADLEKSARQFQYRYDYPRCVAALDGKHIAIKKPHGTGSQYFNYKNFFSVVLLAVVDVDYRIIWYDLGAAGRNSDAGIYNTSELKRFIESNDHLFPATENLGTVGPVPYHILIDGGFAMTTRMLRPFTTPQSAQSRPRRHYNAKLSGSRRIVESCFGILCRRFTILMKALPLEPGRVCEVVLALMILHNLIARRQDALAHSTRFAPLQGNLVGPLQGPRGNIPTCAKTIRDRLVTYYSQKDNIV